MLERYRKHVSAIPNVDQVDIFVESSFFGDRPFPDGRPQANPEYSQTSYLRMRHQEESYQIFNYLDESFNMRLQNHLNRKSKADTNDNLMSKKDRQVCLRRLFMLHEKKKYKIETLFVAVNIFDRYLLMTGHWNKTRDQYVQLCVISMVLAGKLEQPMQPCYDRMTQYLNETERTCATIEKLEKLEYDILIRFGFDFNF